MDNLNKQVAFISELEKLKLVYRQNMVLGGVRQENSAEHSWHAAMMALLLQEHIPFKVDISKVVTMLLIHDIVEIETGDTWVFDTKARKEVEEKEDLAADKLFGMLPKSQHLEYLKIWREFEEGMTPDARFAKAMDVLNPLLGHIVTAPSRTNPMNIKSSQVREKKSFIKDLSPSLWELVEELIVQGVEKGVFLEN